MEVLSVFDEESGHETIFEFSEAIEVEVDGAMKLYALFVTPCPGPNVPHEHGHSEGLILRFYPDKVEQVDRFKPVETEEEFEAVIAALEHPNNDEVEEC